MRGPPFRRFLAPVVLALFAGWELLCFSDNLQRLEKSPQRFPGVTWPATWQMFTFKASGQESLAFEGRFGSVWVPIPMEEWYPARWESGYRWEAAASQKARLQPFLQVACERSGATETRMVRHVWKRTLATAAQFEQNAKVDVRGTLACR